MKNKSVKQVISNMKRFNIDTLNTISNKYSISLTLAVFYYNATH